ncbi:hypothetical protein PHLCEN_2v12198 [Hermanssonia centrifuga]|uniref:Uncharacterized protein n=1 Tax=Hermanssonia centrifuga TaxID=98765 RepID=A0A2R6NIA3_9APHY|nr:hypothetical protein PHLCEN_2v12198 [Hermanssonia centrifuga]
MGKSAKFLKKPKKSSIQSSGTGRKPTALPKQAPVEQKKKAGLKSKVHIRKPGSEGHVLGGADYVGLLMGGRKKAREEAAKLPQDQD